MLDNIELITCTSGDYEVLMLNGKEFAAGHSIRNQDWISLLDHLCYKVKEKEISDKEMERGYR